MSPPIQYRRYRAPARHGEKFFDPPWSNAPQLVEDNIRLRSSFALDVAGMTLGSLAIEARDELCRLAVEYTQRYRSLPPRVTSAGPMILTGHQPRLFHPGVLFKNVVLHLLAEQVRGVAINLIVDNDLTGSASVRVPSGTVSEPRLTTVAYDDSTADLPFEERRLIDQTLFNSFGDRTTHQLEPFGVRPLVHQWWPQAIEASRRDSNLGRCIAAARHQLEASWGLNSLELPVSRMCETASFRRFVLYLFEELPSFLQCHNRCLLEYRRVNRIRSRSHPVPELEVIPDGWSEAPLWVWTVEDPHRRRLFVRRSGPQWDLTDRNGNRWKLPRGIAERPDAALDAFSQLAQRGIKIRPRALMTTMYARLVLSDLFIHGIGGGKYDQLNDAIMQQWLGIEPPRFLVATATAQLPIARSGMTDEDLKRVDRQLRDLDYNPDRYVQGHEAGKLAAEKQAWILNEPVLGSPKSRHDAIARINKLLQPFVAELRPKLVLERDRMAQLRLRDRLLGSRQLSFCLFPEETLRTLLLDNG